MKSNIISFVNTIISALFILIISQTAIAQDTDKKAFCKFDTPRDSPMPILNYRSYNADPTFTGSITVMGENGPDLSPYRKLDIAYTNNQLVTFFFQHGSTFQQVDLIPNTVSAFDQVNPELTLSNTGIDNFDGSYYVTIMENEAGPDFQDFIMVSKTGDFSIYFSYSDNPPNCLSTENAAYDEAVDGDLSLDKNAPTAIVFSPGDNRIISSQLQTVDQSNFFTFQISEGYELSQLIVERYEGSGNPGFIGIDAGSIIEITPPSFIGGLSYGTTNIGTDILPAMGDLSNPAATTISGFGFTPPLNAKQYTVWLNQTDANSTSILNFIVSANDDNLSVIDYGLENEIELNQNYPNPFDSTTTIEYSLSKKSNVNLNIYNLRGQLVKSLNKGVQNSGNHKLTFDLDNMSNGVYLSIIVTDEGSQKQLIVLEN